MNKEFYNRHYITTRQDSAIINAWSDGPHPENATSDAVCINERGGYQLRLTINGKQTEENPPIYTMDGIPLYKWDGSQVIPRTEEEIAAERALLPPTQPSELQQLQSDVDFLYALGGRLR